MEKHLILTGADSAACSDIINIVAERHKQNSDEVWPGSSVG